jgi:hypothetical protein
MKRWWTALAAVCVAGTGCQPGGSRSPADLADLDPPPPPQTLSRFNVPIQYDFTPVMTTVERVVPKTFGSLDSVKQVPDDPRRHYAFEATRTPFTAFVVGSQVHLRTTLSYAARGYYKPVVGPTVSAGCGAGTERPRLMVELVTPLTLDSAWHLKSKARLAAVERASNQPRDQCKVSVVRIDVTDKVVDAARSGLEAQLPQIDKRIAAVSLKDHAVDWWAALNRPIRLRDAIWLKLQPTRLRLGKITGSKRVLTIQAGVDAYPRIVSGAEPVIVSSPLPALAGAPGADGFDIVIDGNIDYPTVSKTLTAVLKGKTVTTGGRTIAIDSIAASGRPGGRVVLTLLFSGDSKGVLMLNGTPTFDRAIGEIHMADLDYDLDTDNGLVDAVAWVKSDDLRAMLRDKARIPVAPVLDRGQEILSSGLNRTIGNALTLSAKVDSVEVRELYVRRPGIVVRAAARGKAKVAVLKKPLPPPAKKKR